MYKIKGTGKWKPSFHIYQYEHEARFGFYFIFQYDRAFIIDLIDDDEIDDWRIKTGMIPTGRRIIIGFNLIFFNVGFYLEEKVEVEEV